MKEPEEVPPAPFFDGSQLCRTVDPDLFFPHPSERDQIALVKRVCQQCKFQEACLEYALWEPGLDGVWGGTTPRQRETLRTKARKYRVAS